MAPPDDESCPRCGEQGKRRRDQPNHYTECYICTASDCPVIEYTSAGEIAHEAGCPEMKRDVLEARGML